MINVVCFQRDEGEKLRRLTIGDAVTLDGHLTVKHVLGRPSSIGLNVRHVTNTNK
jgi:hypothetical protein